MGEAPVEGWLEKLGLGLEELPGFRDRPLVSHPARPSFALRQSPDDPALRLCEQWLDEAIQQARIKALVCSDKCTLIMYRLHASSLARAHSALKTTKPTIYCSDIIESASDGKDLSGCE